jgi:serine/threonine protein kinase
MKVAIMVKQLVAQIMAQICSGLAYMHKKEIMHRDLKLENILLLHPQSFDLVIADYGLATTFGAKGGIKKYSGYL